MSTLPYVYAAILDVLGYRKRLEHDREQGVLDFKHVLVGSLQCLHDINTVDFPYQTISDTVILTCNDRTRLVDFLRVLRNVQVSFLLNGVFLRGGVAFQQHFCSGAITYSHAYAGAYEIQATLAIYPRIVVDHNIIEMLESSGDVGCLKGSELLCECNGIYFVNIVDKNNWHTLFDKASAIYNDEAKQLHRSEREFVKHYWFQEYLMSSAHVPPGANRYIPGIRVFS